MHDYDSPYPAYEHPDNKEPGFHSSSAGYDAPAVPYVPYAAQQPITEPKESVLPPSIPMPLPQQMEKVLPKRRRRLGLWLSLGGILLIMIVAGGGFLGYQYINRSTPMKTLDAFCRALQAENYHAAYGHFTPNLKKQFSEKDFSEVIALDKVVSCTHGAVGEDGTKVSTTLKLVHLSKGTNDDTVLLTKDADNTWRINDLQRVS